MSYPSRFTEFFGPCMWKTMHSIAFSYPEDPSAETRKSYIDFFRSLGPVIPCPSCGAHYETFLRDHPIEAADRESLARWVYAAHDNVNKIKGVAGPSFETVRERYAGWDKAKHDAYQALPAHTKRRDMGGAYFPTGAGVDSVETQALKFLAITAVAVVLALCARRVRAAQQGRSAQQEE
jgi:hypothetical protein